MVMCEGQLTLADSQITVTLSSARALEPKILCSKPLRWSAMPRGHRIRFLYVPIVISCLCSKTEFRSLRTPAVRVPFLGARLGSCVIESYPRARVFSPMNQKFPKTLSKSRTQRIRAKDNKRPSPAATQGRNSPDPDRGWGPTGSAIDAARSHRLCTF